MTGELITRGNLDTNRHREGRPSEDSGRRQPSISQGQHFGLGLLASSAVRCQCLLFKPPRLWYQSWQPYKIIHPVTPPH